MAEVAADVVADLLDHHAEINRAILDVASLIPQVDPDSKAFPPLQLRSTLTRVRDLVFIHFAREEEGLFPFLEDAAPDLRPSVEEMLAAHDTICGALARMVHVSTTDSVARMPVLFERFQTAYAQHARNEEILLSAVDRRLDAVQRDRLRALLDGI
jgi:iron-sulfur cluster repair protein YtfE (RIC family)